MSINKNPLILVLVLITIYIGNLSFSQNTIDGIAKSLVKIKTYNSDNYSVDRFGVVESEYSYGTGIYISEYGHILTAYHVIEESSSMSTDPYTCTSHNGEIFTPLYVWHDKNLDIAILLDPNYTGIKTNKNFINLKNISNNIKKGHQCISFGFPNEIQNVEEILAISTGIIKYVDKNLPGHNKLKYRKNVIVTSSNVIPGFSGGIVTDINMFPIGVILGTYNYSNKKYSFVRNFEEIRDTIFKIISK